MQPCARKLPNNAANNASHEQSTPSQPSGQMQSLQLVGSSVWFSARKYPPCLQTGSCTSNATRQTASRKTQRCLHNATVLALLRWASCCGCAHREQFQRKPKRFGEQNALLAISSGLEVGALALSWISSSAVSNTVPKMPWC